MNIEKLENFFINNYKGVIAIDGPSGSGKSTLGKYLEDNYNVLLFHTDDYFLPPTRKTEARLNEVGGNLDYERMYNEIFMNLDNEYIESNKFNCMTNELEKRPLFKRGKYIVIEGVYSLHPLFQEFYDFTVFIDIDRDTQKQRILERSNEFMLNRFCQEWIPLEDKYFEQLRIRDIVDLTVKG